MNKTLELWAMLCAIFLLSACVPGEEGQVLITSIPSTENLPENATPTDTQTPQPEPTREPTLEGSPDETLPLVEWQRSGGIAGLCRHLTLYKDGSYQYSDCREYTLIREGKLSGDQLAYFTDLAQRYGDFRWEFNPPKKAADMFVDWYLFHGEGSETPSERDMREINNRLAKLTTEITSQPTLSGADNQFKTLLRPASPRRASKGAAGNGAEPL